MGKPTAVQFGAGQIGRGFIGALFHESGYETVFVEAALPLVDKLNKKGAYTLHIVGEDAAEVQIAHISALHVSETERIADALEQAVIFCTAVGVHAMPAVAPLIAAGVQRRFESKIETPLNCLTCENQLHADQLLREYVRGYLPPETYTYLDQKIGFVQCVVSRMVPIATDIERETLEIRAESYKKLPADKSAFKGEPSEMIGLMPVDNFEAYIERKLFVHNASHAMLGYFGALKGYEYGWEALLDPTIKARLDAAMLPICEAMHLKWGFGQEEMQAHLNDLYRRYANRDLGDTVFRLARDPMRKLRSDDRLVGAAMLVQTFDLDFDPLCFAIAAALRFDHPDDAASQQLQAMLREKGIASVLKTICGIEPNSPLALLIQQHYQRLEESSKF